MPHVQTTGFQPLAATLPGAAHGRDRALQRSLRDEVADALDVRAKGNGIAGLAVAIRDKLAASDGSNQAVSSVLETINRALDDAAGKLAAQGLSQEQIDAGVARFRNKLAREIGELAGPVQPSQEQPPSKLEKSAIAVREVVRERLSLDILTAGGDKVSIRFKSLNVTEVAAARVSDGENTAITAEANVISRGRFKVEVDGDLNEAERTAIADLLDKVEDIATDFFAGDVQEAFNAAARVGLGSEALSAFDLKLSYSRSLTAVQTYANNAKLGDAPAPAVTPKPVATEPAKLPTRSTPAAPVSAVSAATTTPAVEPVTTPVPAETVTPVESTPTNPSAAANAVKTASALETITQFTKDILERLDKDDESDAPKFSLRWKVEFLVKAFGSVALTPVEQKAADALGIALDGQASKLI